MNPELLDELFSGLDEELTLVMPRLDNSPEDELSSKSKGRNQLNQVFDFALAMGLGARLEDQPIS